MDRITLFNFCKEQRENGKTWTEVLAAAKKAKLITLLTSQDSLKNIYRSVAAEMAVTNGTLEKNEYDENVKKFFKYIGKSRDNIKTQEKSPKQSKDNISLVISDLHVPYHDIDKIRAVVDEWKSKANRLIIAGDFLNGTQLSTHPKMVAEDFQKEVAEGRLLLEWFAADFDEVILLDDNHVHSRWERYLAKNLTPDLHFLVTHPYDYLTAGLDNVKRASKTNDFIFAEEFGWLFKIGDAIFTHAEVSSNVEFKAVRRVQDFLSKWAPVLNLGNIRFIAQAHNHKLGIYHDVDSAVAYTGCMVGLKGLTYSMKAPAVGSPPVHGFLVLVQDENGRTDLVRTEVKRIPL